METVIEHPLESEIAGTPPRRVRLPWRTQTLLTLAGTLALLLFFGGARALLDAAQLAWAGTTGRTTVARVTQVQTETDPAAGSSTRPSSLRYEYADPFDGTRVSRFARINAEPTQGAGGPSLGSAGNSRPAQPPVIRVGDPLPLRIARWRGRSVSFFWRPVPWGKGIFLALCGLVVMGVSLRLLRTLARWRRHRTSLLSQGQAVVGTIIHKQADVGDTPRFYLRYGYGTVAAGEKLEHEEQVSQEQWKRFEIGQPVTVLYDPERPVRAGLYALMKHG